MTDPTPEAEPFHAYPPDVTFHDLIATNRRNSVLLVIGMGVLTIGVVMALAVLIMGFGGTISPEGLIIAAIVGFLVVIIGGLWSYYGGSNAILRMSGAKEIAKADDPQLFNVVEEMAIAAGQPMPKVYIIDSQALNAFATGRDPEHAAVAVTKGLREKLTRDELTGVIAHEIAHIRHQDIRLTMLVATMVGLVVLVADGFTRSLFYGSLMGGRRRGGMSMGGGGRGGGKGGGGGVLMIVLIVIAVIFLILAPVFAKLIQFAISRQREYLADAGAVELTRYPQGLASALQKLAGDDTPLESANRATAHLYIVNPILHAKHRDNLNSVMSTHPPLKQRIERIHALLK
ncbi:MAG: M48 family metallopeptidase [Phycisphaeraceae bacterium]